MGLGSAPAAPTGTATPAPSVPSTPLASVGLSPNRVSLPAGAGKIQGMGESFSAELSTGVGAYSVPVSVPKGRGGMQPPLTLTYSSSRGYGNAGLGWSLGVGLIARQTDRGVPQYLDPPQGGGWTPTQDRFVFGGGQELVPICLVSGGACTGVSSPGTGAVTAALSGAGVAETFPAWANGWQYFRPRVEGGFQRIFWSPDHRTWRAQNKAGEISEFGASLDQFQDASALETDPTGAMIFRWNLVRTFDANGDGSGGAVGLTVNPVNVVQYRYWHEPGTNAVYLQDVYDTPPATAWRSAGLPAYAHHVRVHYQPRPDVGTSFNRGWLVTSDQRVTNIDVSSAGVNVGTLQQLRRYWLQYDGQYHPSLLSSVTMEARCGTTAAPVAISEDGSGSLPSTSAGCPTLPALTFSYQHVAPYAMGGGAGVADIPGYEGFDERLWSMAGSPTQSLQAQHTELFDVNGDGLPDVLSTDVEDFSGNHGLYLNGYGGAANTFVEAQPMGVPDPPEPGVTPSVLTFTNANVSVQDLDGDGIMDLLHMPQVKQYAVYSPQGSGLSWSWAGRAITTAAQQSQYIDFQNHATRIREMDVNGDGLVDVVYSAGTEYETFFSLGRYAGDPTQGIASGDGQFGHATWTSATSASISNTPVVGCVPWSATPVMFDDPDVFVADMNSDGLPDVVRVRTGDIMYWPGRGNGQWGTGSGCSAGGVYAEGQEIAMATAPDYTVAGAQVSLSDVNGDGFPDLVVNHPGTVEIWLNVDGQGWTTAHHSIVGAPLLSAIGGSVEMADLNGSGTPDLVWGNAGDYQFMDVLGGQQPWVLTQVSGGLGSTTTITYAPSTQMMLQAARANNPWATTAPMPVQVVSQVTVTDGLAQVGLPQGTYTTQYVYRDPVYDGRQREFRGFTYASTTVMGDQSSPTSTTEERHLLGQCVDEMVSGVTVDYCSPAARWKDNPREALKGLTSTEEVHDGTSSLLMGGGICTGCTYESTSHTTWRMKQPYVGLDGRMVRFVYGSQSDSTSYDQVPAGQLAYPPPQFPVGAGYNVPFDNEASGSGEVALDDVELDWDTTPPTQNVVGEVALRGSTYAHTQSQSPQASVDAFGNHWVTQSNGCIGGPSCSGPDEVFTSEKTFALPSGDGTGWSWRVTHEYTTASQHAGNWAEAFYAYDSLGRLIAATSAPLAGTLPLVRSNPSGGGVASAPLNASAPGDVVNGQAAYDVFGNRLAAYSLQSQTASPDYRCTSAIFDSEYAQVPVQSATYVGQTPASVALAPGVTATCAPTRIVSNVSLFDRGFEAATYLLDPAGQPSSVVLDGFGRLVSATGPDPRTTSVLAPNPDTLVAYALGAPWSSVTTYVQTGPDVTSSLYEASVSYGDALGRTLATLTPADPSAGDQGNWVLSPRPVYDAKGAVERAYLDAFFTGPSCPQPATNAAPCDPYSASFSKGVPAGTGSSVSQHDAFGRTIQVTAPNGDTTQTVYHPLSTDAWDAEDLSPGGAHHGTYATTVVDGHGRTVQSIERLHLPAGTGTLVSNATSTQYSPIGSPLTVTRSTSSGGASVTRTMQYDSWGRLVSNVDPDMAGPWLYAYDDRGDLVGTADPRGCGVNTYYDASGRPYATDYSPCLASQAPYTPPLDLPTMGDGTESFTLYDAPDPALGQAGLPLLSPLLYLGRVGSVSDVGSKVLSAYDGVGRVVGTGKQVVTPGTPSSSLATRYATGASGTHWWTTATAYDAQGHVVAATTGAEALTGQLVPGGTTSTIQTTYSLRGLPTAVAGSYGTVIAASTIDPNGKPTSVTYGDHLGTTTQFAYDPKLRLICALTSRAPVTPLTPACALGTTQTGILYSSAVTYDGADNPVALADNRNPAEWLAGSKPVSRTVTYDDLYRPTNVQYAYTLSSTSTGIDAWTSPYAFEYAGGTDPRRGAPSPSVQFANRVASESFQYDWLGNMTASGDDAGGFYDRSLGTIANGYEAGGGGPYQLVSASNVGASGAASPGSLTTAYDAAGHLTSMAVQRGGPCLPAGSSCDQRYWYDWNEVGQLARARRWDGDTSAASAPMPTTTPSADLSFAYGGGGRVLKTWTDGSGTVRHTVWVFGSLSLRGAQYFSEENDYDRSENTETVDLGVARLSYEPNAPTLHGTTAEQLHVLLRVDDALGSTSVLIDQDTGDLGEARTYTAYGQTESDDRPAGFDGLRDDVGFTGKEDDVELGIQYFGARYLVPALGRWASADPLAVHALGADLNVYAYVHGKVFSATDPTGLTDGDPYGSCKQDVASCTTPIDRGPDTDAAEADAAAKQMAADADRAHDKAVEYAAHPPPPAAKETVEYDVERGTQSANPGQLMITTVGLRVESPPPLKPGESLQPADSVDTEKDGIWPLDAETARKEDNWEQRDHYEHLKERLPPWCQNSQQCASTLIMAGAGLTPGAAAVPQVQLPAPAFRVLPLSPQTSPSTSAECAGGVCPCFVGETLVDTISGPKEIERVELGDRVGPEAPECATDVFARWREVDLEMTVRQDDVADTLSIRVLRPEAWLGENHVAPGAMIDVDLDELNVRGPARVTGVRGTRPITDGARCPVTGLIHHRSHDVVQLRLEELGETLGVTRQHRLYSADRDDWVRAGDLTDGEALRTMSGVAHVLHLDPRAVPPVEVFNIEVFGVHQYYVGSDRVRAHNQYMQIDKEFPDPNVGIKCGAGRCLDIAIELYKKTSRLTGNSLYGDPVELSPAEGVEYMYPKAGRSKGGRWGRHAVNFLDDPDTGVMTLTDGDQGIQVLGIDVTRDEMFDKYKELMFPGQGVRH